MFHHYTDVYCLTAVVYDQNSRQVQDQNSRPPGYDREGPDGNGTGTCFSLTVEQDRAC